MLTRRRHAGFPHVGLGMMSLPKWGVNHHLSTQKSILRIRNFQLCSNCSISNGSQFSGYISHEFPLYLCEYLPISCQVGPEYVGVFFGLSETRVALGNSASRLASSWVTALDPPKAAVVILGMCYTYMHTYTIIYTYIDICTYTCVHIRMYMYVCTCTCTLYHRWLDR